MKTSIIVIIAIIGYALTGVMGLETLNLTTENDSLKSEIQALRSDSNILDLTNLDQQTEITQIGLELDELNQNYSILISTSESLSEEKHQLEIDNNQKQEDNKLLNNQINELNTENTNLQDKVTTQQIEIEELKEEKNLVSVNNTIKYNLIVYDYNSLLDDYNLLKNDYNFLIDDYNVLVNEYNDLLSDDSSLQSVYDQLKIKYDLWRLHADLAPKNRIAFDVTGYLPSAGEYTISQSSVLISFPDPENCLLLGDISFTGSMRPAMHGGHTAIETTCFSNSDLQLGDMIAYDDNEGTIILHQIIEIRPEGVIAKGINNEIADPDLVLWADIIALVIAIVY